MRNFPGVDEFWRCEQVTFHPTCKSLEKQRKNPPNQKQKVHQETSSSATTSFQSLKNWGQGMRFQYTTCFDLNDKKSSSSKFQGVFSEVKRASVFVFPVWNFETKKGLEKKLLKLGDLKIHGIFRFLPELDREIPWLHFQGHPRTRGWKQNSGVAFCLAKAEGFCVTKNRESMVIEPIWQGEGYDWGIFLDHFHEGEEIW